MSKTATSPDAAGAAAAIAALLDEHRCEDSLVLELGGLSDVAEYFVLGTVMSEAHLTGVIRGVLLLTSSSAGWRRFAPRGNHKRPGSSGWELLDCGDILVHLMDAQNRDFYELEKLWFSAELTSYSSSKSPSGASPSPSSEKPSLKSSASP
jgi:ribosome-associated protein